MGPLFQLLYGIVVYALFAGTFVHAILFAGNLFVTRSVDAGPASPLWQAIVMDLALLGVFAVQHSVMARRGFKVWWTRIVPPGMERSTYVLAATAALALLLWQWRPISEPVIWDATGTAAAIAIHLFFWLGWAVLLLSTFPTNHFELFALRQVYAESTGRSIPKAEFRTPLLYRHVRHPIYLGFLMAFWAA